MTEKESALDALENMWRAVIAATGRAPTRIRCGTKFRDAFAAECKSLVPITESPSVRPPIDPGEDPDCFFKGIRLEVFPDMQFDGANVT
jgi:hypothetical protein